MSKVAIIGAGQGGTSLLEIFHKDPLVQIIGIADVDKNAPGMQLARKLHIPVTKDYKRLLKSKEADLVVDVTGNPLIEEALQRARRPGMSIIGGHSAKFMWQLIDERIRSKEKIEKHLLEYQSLYRLYVKEVELAIAKERTRIAYDIHDGLVQTLAGLNYHIEYCIDQIEKHPTAAAGAIRKTQKLLKEAIAEAREVVFNLRPIYLDRSGLYTALSKYMKTYQRQYKIKTQLKTSGSESVILPEAKVFIFRIILEALANVQKHADASEVTVQVITKKGLLKAAIIDNGTGFKPKKHQSENQTSFGLEAISERARLLGGEAKIKSQMGVGTTVAIEIPLPEEAVS
ncbi:Gfo/Idh/MocA family oxidoreductase [Nitrospira defluvii]|nr:Gfo/Idh/MocA family oxidoreductase [Nitrospira defluvii]